MELDKNTATYNLQNIIKGGLTMQQQKQNEISFKIINKHPVHKQQEGNRKKEAVRADLYHIYKKYM